MAQRIKGEDVVVTFTGPSGPEDGLTDISNFEAEIQLDILKEGYIGETTDRRDDIFRGVTGSVDINMSSADYFRFLERVKDRAQNRGASDAQFEAQASFSFPNGERVRLSFENIFFANLPISVPDRASYVKSTISWECSDYRTVL